MNLKELSKEFNYLNESELKVGDIVVPSMGPHEGEKHEIIYDFGNGKYNIRPLGFKNKYRMGAAGAMKDQLTKVADAPMRPEPKVIDTSDIDEGTCGYGVDGKPADKPAGPHLIRKAIREEIKKLKEGLDSKSFDMIQAIADKYSYGEILDALESFYIKNDEQNSARIANIHAKEFRRVLDMPNPFKKLKEENMPEAAKIWDALVKTFADNKNDSLDYLNKDKTYRNFAIQAIFRAMNF